MAVSIILELNKLKIIYKIRAIIDIGVKYFKLIVMIELIMGIDILNKLIAKNRIINITSIITIFCKINRIVFINIEFPKLPCV